MRKEIADYMKDNRNAIILESKEGLEVDLYEDKYYIETKYLHSHNKQYAMDLATNWINKIRGNNG